MTVAAWLGFSVMALLLIILVACVGSYLGETKGIIIGLVVGFVLSLILLVAMLWYYNNTASGSRALKTQQSNFTNGIKRKVEVYDATGNLIKEYVGTFDIEYDDDRILFDDEHGLRHIIYYPTGTVIVDELAE